MCKQNYSDYSITTTQNFHQVISWCCEFPYFSFRWKMEFIILPSITYSICDIYRYNKIGPLIG